MGEALISRAGGGSDVETIIPITPGYHTILVTARDYEGSLLNNFKIQCNDGALSYEYTTNALGQVLFVTNSGAANICLNNNINGIQYIDFNATWCNVDAPVGLTSRVNIEAEKSIESYEFLSNKQFALMLSRECDIILVGGGGGGGYHESSPTGGGGGAGYMNQYNNQVLNKGIYRYIVGSGGAAANTSGGNNNGYSGGTSYIENTAYSAIGGQGGYCNLSRWAQGGLGNGARPGSVAGTNGGNSSVDFAGGGGGSGGNYYDSSGYNGYMVGLGGWPYGGNGGGASGGARAGSRGGGGGGGGWFQGWSSLVRPAAGGSGLMRINIHYT